MPDPIYILPGDKNNFRVKYEDQNDPGKKAALENAWKHFNRYDPATGETYYLWYRQTSPKSEVMVDYSLPPTAPFGLYRIEVFVPGRHATTRLAIFTIANNFRSEDGKLVYDDTVASIDMYHIFDAWVSLGEYLVNSSAHPLSGRVRQHIISLEDPPASVSFGPLRWVPLATMPVPIPTTPGHSSQPAPTPSTTTTTPSSSNAPSPRPEGMPQFSAPVGTLEERSGPFTSGRLFAGYGPIWLGNWYDATPFLAWYVFGYHTGADLNLTVNPAADKDAPVYAAGDGKVVYAGSAGSWGNIIVIEHSDALVSLPNGNSRRQRVYSRYGHVSNRILVSQGEEVKLGQHIGYIGLMRGATSGWHLHFDISYSEILKTRPAHWPNLNTIQTLRAQGKENTREYANAQLQVKKEVLAHYVDPLKFLKDNH
jgi:murein DD-endopeptidase MepM/ murein hydrolase activator NlpD